MSACLINSSKPLEAVRPLRLPERSFAWRFSFVIALLVSGASVVSRAESSPENFDALLGGFARMPGFEARFEEEKHLALLAVPLRSEGRLYFSPPQLLLRRVETPRPQDILVSRNAIRIREAGREEVIDLAARSEVRPLVESLIWIFSGDQKALEEAYSIEFEPTTEKGESTKPSLWRLRLRPRNEPLSLLLERLEIFGSGHAAGRIEVSEKNGDRSIMRVFDANPNRQFDRLEHQSLFGLGSSDPAPSSDEEDE